MRERIREVLEAHSTLTLATTSNGRPWAATVFYASDPELCIYFVSDQRTRHARDLAQEPQCVAAIHADVSTWDEVLGLQVEGWAEPLTAGEREDAQRLYLDKFADVQRLFEAPRDDSERLIGHRLRGANFYRLTPRWIRIVDNNEGFGWKWELEL